MLNADYSVALARSLVDRAGSLGQYILSLEASYNRSDDAYNAALELFHSYTQAVIQQVESDMSLGVSDGRAKILEIRLLQFSEKEQLFDQRFARGGQSQVPRALHTLAKRELWRLGLADFEAVLTVGPPDSFETHRADLATYLFGDFRGIGIQPRASQPSQKLAVVSVPYIEGTRALWFPICLGHELAHVRIENTRKTDLHLPDFGGDVDETDHDLAMLLDEQEGFPESSGLGQMEGLRSQLRSWTEELACDLNAVRTFGPAGLSSIAEFLSTLRVTPTDARPWTPQQASRTHPSLRTRVLVMARMLEQVGFKEGISYLDSWKKHAQSTEGTPTRAAEYLTSLVLARQDELISHVLGWADLGFTPSRCSVSGFVAERLLKGIPGSSHCQIPDSTPTRVTVPDVVNASWSARDQLTSPESAVGHQLGKDYKARVTLDELASKAIDDLEFCALWRIAGRHVVDVESLDNPKLETAGGILSRRIIMSRMLSNEEGRRLTITPLLDVAIQDSGIDIRLGADFIVFRHSATSVFDSVALDERIGHSQDPRKIQEKVAKSWGEPFILHPGELVLASTMEYIVLPDDVAAQVVTRSSYGRLGLITATAVQVQPGSRNCITLELVNHGPTPIALMPGARLAQLVLTHVPHSLPPTTGKYWHPIGPEFSKVREDPDAEAIRLVARIAQYSPTRDDETRTTSGPRDFPFRFEGKFESAYAMHCLLEAASLQSRFRTLASADESGELAGPSVQYTVEGSAGMKQFLRVLASIASGSEHGLRARTEGGEVQLAAAESVASGVCEIITAAGSTTLLDVKDPNSLIVFERVLASEIGPGDGRWSER